MLLCGLGVEIESGGVAESAFLGRRHGVKYEGDFPAEVCATGAAVHDDGFEAHDAMVSCGREVNTECEGGAWLAGATAAENGPVFTDLLSFEPGKSLPCGDTGASRPCGGDRGRSHRWE